MDWRLPNPFGGVHYEVHWAASNRADQMVAFRKGARRHKTRESAEKEARTIRPPKPTLTPIVVEVQKRVPNPFRYRVAEVEVFGRHFQIEVERDDTVQISHWSGDRWVWSCQGRLENGQIVDCAAELWPGNADRTEEVFEALEEAVS